MKYMCDLETTNDRITSRVWLWGLAAFNDQEDFTWGCDLDQLMSIMLENSATFYFHDLKFDGETIVCWLFSHGFQWVEERLENGKAGQFGTLINSKGEWYKVWIRTKTARVQLLDSRKIISMPVGDMPRAFGLPERKGEIDLKKKRPLDYMPTLEEIDYVRRDVLIPLKCLKVLFRNGLTRNTQAANALADYKKIVGDRFEQMFPELPLEDYDIIRHSYKGGWCYLNPRYKGEVLHHGTVVDKNSMYSWIMRTKVLPFGHPVHYEGKYPGDPRYPLWIGLVRFHFDIKPGRFPSIEIKAPGPWGSNEYLADNLDEDVCLCLTSIDWQVIEEQYEVYNVEWMEGWMFRGQRGMFDRYVDKWYAAKVEADQQENDGLRQAAKIMQVALYGIFGKCPYQRNLIPSYHAGTLYFTQGEEEIVPSIFVPLASFVTAYSRQEVIRAAQENADTFIYSDTDSLHLVSKEVRGVKLDRWDLDGWKLEASWDMAKYLKQKTYLYVEDGETTLKCAGLPYGARADITIDKFYIGARFKGKLRPVHLKGGMALIEGWHTITG